MDPELGLKAPSQDWESHRARVTTLHTPQLELESSQSPNCVLFQAPPTGHFLDPTVGEAGEGGERCAQAKLRLCSLGTVREVC